MAEETRDLVLRLLLEIPDAKVPPLDTKEADAALAAWKERAKQTTRDVAREVGQASAAVAGVGRGPTGSPTGGLGLPPGSASSPFGMSLDEEIRARRTRDDINREFATAAYLDRQFGPPDRRRTPVNQFGGFFGRSAEFNQAAQIQRYLGAPAPFSGGFGGSSPSAAGPIPPTFAGPASRLLSGRSSDAQASLGTARGYDVALLREQMQGFDRTGLDSYDKSLQNLGASLRTVRFSAASAAASVALLNNALSKDELGPADYGQIALSGLFGAASLPGLARGTVGLSQAGLGLAGRGITRGGAALVGAGATGAGTLLTRVGGSIVRGASVGGRVGGLGLLAGATYGLNRGIDAFFEQQHAQQIAGSRNLLAATHQQNLLDLEGLGVGRLGRGFALDAARFQAGRLDLDEVTGSYRSVTSRLRGGIDRNRPAASLINLRALQGVESIYTDLQQGDLREREVANLQQQAGLRDEIAGAADVTGAAGRLGVGGRRSLVALLRRFEASPSERTALDIESRIGRRAGGRATEFLDEVGQKFVDQNPLAREFFGSATRTSDELQEISDQLKAAEEARTVLVQELKELLLRSTETQLELTDAIEQMQIRQGEQEKANANLAR